jgi:DNA-binding PadR family transcriptional regulator
VDLYLSQGVPGPPWRETIAETCPYDRIDHTASPMPDPHSLLPLKPVEFLILLALAEQDQHGYAITRELADRTDGLVRLEPGNLYRVLKRLVVDGLIEAADHRPVAELENERRRYYRITRLGAATAALEAERLHALLASSAVQSLTKRFGTP